MTRIKDLGILPEKKDVSIESLQKNSFAENMSRNGFNQAIAQIGAIEVEIDEEKVIGALARGYCHKENEKKELDSTLLQAILVELSKGDILKIKGK